jgi:hypothetical protein
MEKVENELITTFIMIGLSISFLSIFLPMSNVANDNSWTLINDGRRFRRPCAKTQGGN